MRQFLEPIYAGFRLRMEKTTHLTHLEWRGVEGLRQPRCRNYHGNRHGNQNGIDGQIQLVADSAIKRRVVCVGCVCYK